VTVEPDLPPSWIECSLGDIIDYGRTEKVEPDQIPANAWVLELEDIEKDSSRVIQHVTFAERKSKSTKNRFKSGDVLYGKLRPYLNKVVHAVDSGFCTTEIVPLTPPPGLDGGYLFYWLKHPRFIEYVTAVSHGLNMPRLGTEAGKAAPFVLAPGSEQKRIAEKLDALFARLDACQGRLDRIPRILKRLRQSVIAAAISGELTREWREERGFEDAWVSVRLADLGQLGRGKSKHRPRNDPRLYGGPYPFIQTGDIAQSGGKIERHTQTYSELGLAQSRIWPVSTLCITIAANIADTAILTYPACFPDSVVGFVANPSRVIPEFVKWSIDVISERLETLAPATAQKNINLAILNDIELRCPDLDEQAEIVRRVQMLLDSISSLDVRTTAARKAVEGLISSALVRAFCGELVPQDPNDEPASKLLARLRTRAASPGNTGKSKRGGTRGMPIMTTADTNMLTRKDITPTHLTTILKVRGALTAEALWTASQLKIDEFYDQLKEEEARGLLRENRGDAANSPRLLEPAA
jgi:type I restriction enzyme S subunit